MSTPSVVGEKQDEPVAPKKINFTNLNTLIQSPLSKDEWWYLVDKKWYDKCIEYISGPSETDTPGPIDNSALFESTPNPSNLNNFSASKLATTSLLSNGGVSSLLNDEAPTTPVPGMPVAVGSAIALGSRPLKKGIEENEDFLVVPKQAWDMLVQSFGIVDPSHLIRRKVIEDAPNHLVVEVHPVSLKLCLYGPKESMVEKQFSRTTQLKQVEEEMRKLFMVNPGVQTQLWATTPSGTNTVFKHPQQENAEDTPPSTNGTPEKASSDKSPNAIASANNQQIVLALPSSAATTSTTTNSVRDSIVRANQIVTRSSGGSTSSVPPPPPPAPPGSLSQGQKEKENTLLQSLQDAGISSNSVLTLELANSDGTWPSSKPRLGAVTRSSKATPGLCGLSNMGNTCFMNAALQCLSNTPQLTNYILTDRYISDINADNPLGMRGEIARTFADLIKTIWSGTLTSFMPREFKCAVGRFAPQFNGFQQQDCQELMAFLLDGLHEDLNRIKKKPYIEIKTEIDRRPDDVVAAESWQNYLRRNDSIVVDTFHALLKSTLVCPECELVSVTFDPFCYLSLPLQVKREKQIDCVIVPANVERLLQLNGTNANSTARINVSSKKRSPIQMTKLSIPKSGPISELCDLVARAVNEAKVWGESTGSDENTQDNTESNHYQLDPSNLIVVEIYNNKVSRVYEPTEHYTRIGDELIIYERGDKYCIPFYVRERKNEYSSAASVVGNVRVIHVPDCSYRTLYDAIYKQLISSNPDLCGPQSVDIEMSPIDSSSTSKSDSNSQAETMDHEITTTSNDNNGTGSTADGDGNKENSNNKEDEIGGSTAKEGELFKISVVNSIGNSTVSTVQPDGGQAGSVVYTSRLYLAADMFPGVLNKPEFCHLKSHKNNANLFDSTRALSFHPRAGPKSTLKLQDCISQFTNIERLGADDPWYCPKCKKHQQATKKFDIWSLPNVLIIHLKRFSFSRSWRDKIDTLVDYPVTDLDMSDYVLSPEERKSSMVYDLIGVANHFGGLGGGHYTAHAKNAPLGTWHYFDDTFVTPASLEQVVSRSGYVLFYQRRT